MYLLIRTIYGSIILAETNRMLKSFIENVNVYEVLILPAVSEFFIINSFWISQKELKNI